MQHEDITSRILKVFFAVYNELGTGFLESVYERAFARALRDAGLSVSTQVAVPVWFRGEIIAEFVADMVVERLVLCELKAARAIDPAHEAQTLNYLRATPLEVALLLNFGPKPEFRRLVFANERKSPRPLPSFDSDPRLSA